MELTLNVREYKADFFLELLNELDFVTILSIVKDDTELVVNE